MIASENGTQIGGRGLKQQMSTGPGTKKRPGVLPGRLKKNIFKKII
jgi:hypothetical protein